MTAKTEMKREYAVQYKTPPNVPRVPPPLRYGEDFNNELRTQLSKLVDDTIVDIIKANEN